MYAALLLVWVGALAARVHMPKACWPCSCCSACVPKHAVWPCWCWCWCGYALQEARDGLALARAAMKREELDALTSDEEEDINQAAPQQQPPNPSGPSELHLSWDRGSRVSTVALVPGGDGTAASGMLLVALNRKVELYAGCNPVARTDVPVADKVRAGCHPCCCRPQLSRQGAAFLPC